MSSEEERRSKHRALMPFPPTLDEKEPKSMVFKCTDCDERQQPVEAHFTHHRLQRAGPLKHLIKHAMDFEKCIAESNLGDIAKATLCRKTLAGAAITAWDNAMKLHKKQLIPENQTEPDMNQFNLRTSLKCFIDVRTTDSSRCNQIKGLEAHKKPRAQECHEWEDRHLLSVEAIDWIKGTAPAPKGSALNRQCLDSHPDGWATDFEKLVTKDVDSPKASVSKITDFVDERAQEANAREAKNRSNQKKAAVVKKTQRTKKHKCNKDRNDKKDSTERIRNEDPCPLPGHKGHTWGACFQNINNPNAKARSSNGNRSKTTSTGHNNAMEVDGEADEADHHHVEDLVEPGFARLSLSPGTSPGGCTSNIDTRPIEEISHHLANVSLQELEPGSTQPLPRLRTRTPVSSGSNSSKRTLPIAASPGQPARNTEGFQAVATQLAVEDMAERVFDPESDLASDGDQCSTEAIGPGLLSAINQRTTPGSMAIIKHINDLTSKTPLRVLFDAGSTHSHICPQALPTGCKPRLCKQRRVKLLNHHISVNKVATPHDIALPEFCATKHITTPFTCFLAEGASSHDITFGMDFMQTMGIDPLPSKGILKWQEHEVPFRPVPKTQSRFRQMQQLFPQSVEPDDTEEMIMNHGVATLESKCDFASVEEVARQQQHLTAQQRQELAALLSKFTKPFSGDLGKCPHKKMDLEVMPGGRDKLRCQRHCPMAHAHKKAFKDESDRLVKLGAIEPLCDGSACASPTFCVPKKDQRMRFVSDFRQLNAVIKRKVCPLPRIQDVLKKRKGCEFFTKLDISMQCCTFELTERAKDSCIIGTLHGLHRHNRAPMGVKQTPDFAQQAMEEALRDIEEIDVHIDDIGCFDNSWQQHLQTSDEVLTRLQDGNFTVNPLKCEWGVKETDWLGHWLTPTGLRPWKKKIDAILNLERPRNARDVRSFVGAVTFYGELFPKRSDVLAPLHDLMQKAKKFKWEARHQRAFEETKSILAKDVFMRHPDHNKPFHACTDASNTQLGAVIMQDNKPVACHSKKLNSAQRNCTAMELELLSIACALNECRTMSHGCKELHVHTDHKNLTCANLNSQRVLRWRLFPEDFAPIFHCMPGATDTLADAPSRPPHKEGKSAATASPKPLSPHTNGTEAMTSSFGMPLSETSDTLHGFCGIIEDDDMLECFLNFPEVDADNPCALSCDTTAEEQKTDHRIQSFKASNPGMHAPHRFTDDGPELVCHQAKDERLRICTPDSMSEEIIQFCHLALLHPGSTRLRDTTAQHFEHPRLRAECEAFVSTCDACQKCKLWGKGHGELPPREAMAVPWHEIAVDLMGPWQLRDAHGKDHEFMALTVIDTTTNLCEIVRIRNKTAKHVGQLLENCWLSRCPMPMKCIYDQGKEFLGQAFRHVIRKHNAKASATGVRTPTANSMVERLHQTVGNALRVLCCTNPPDNEDDLETMIDSALQSAAHAVGATIHTTMGLSPGAACFGRDMFLNMPLVADFNMIKQQREVLINKNLMNENKKRVSHDCQVGDQALKAVWKPHKLQPRAVGPFNVERVHTNGTLTIRMDNHTTDRINIRRVKPHRA